MKTRCKFKHWAERSSLVDFTLLAPYALRNIFQLIALKCGCASTGRGGNENSAVFPVSRADQRIGSRALVPPAPAFCFINQTFSSGDLIGDRRQDLCARHDRAKPIKTLTHPSADWGTTGAIIRSVMHVAVAIACISRQGGFHGRGFGTRDL